MIRIAMLGLACLLASPWAVAQEELTAAQITERVQHKVGLFADALTCEGAGGREPVLPAYLIGALQPYQLDTTDPAEFVGFWRGNLGCKDGSQAATHHLVTVRTDARGAFFVDAAASEPAVSVRGLNARYLQRIVGASLDTMTVEGLDFAAGESSDYPTRTFRYTLKRDADGHWDVTSRQAR